MNLTEFIDIYLFELLQKFLKEDKTIMLTGDFNVGLLKYDHNRQCAVSLFIKYKLPSTIYLNTILSNSTL